MYEYKRYMYSSNQLKHFLSFQCLHMYNILSLDFTARTLSLVEHVKLADVVELTLSFHKPVYADANWLGQINH